MHFNGIFSQLHPPTVCQEPWLQYPWQNADRVGRDEVAMAIAQAETNIEQLLGYRLLPAWEKDEWHTAPRPWRPELFNVTMTDIRGFQQTVQADWGYFVTGGVRAKTAIQAGAAVVPTDPDGDGWQELATATVAVTAGQDPCEVRVYLPGHTADDAYELRPVTVSIVGLVATITFSRTMLVKPSLYDDLIPPADDSHWRGVDAAVGANFETTVDVYRVYNDPATQVTLLWETLNNACGCNTSGCAICQFNTQTGCLHPRGSPRQSVLAYTAGEWNVTDQAFDPLDLVECRSPDAVRLYYYAGWRDKRVVCPTIQLDPQWERVIAYYAAALLDRPICECNNVRAFIGHWQTDMAMVASREAKPRISGEDLANPLGTTRGALMAWKQIKAVKPVGVPVML